MSGCQEILTRLGLLLLLLAAADGQTPDNEPQPAAGALFRVTPLILKLEGNPRDSIPFEVDVLCGPEPLEVSVVPVALGQTETGTLTPLLDGPTGDLSLSDERLSLTAGSTSQVRGEIFLPADCPALLQYGLLISQLSASDGPAASEDREVNVRVRFRYLIRLEVQVARGMQPALSQLLIEEGGLVERDGLAVARVWLTNPSAQPHEVELDAALVRLPSGKQVGPGFPLIMPSRSQRLQANRLKILILPGARIRVEEKLPEPLASGPYRLDVEVRAGKDRRKQSFELEVEAAEFPTQAGLLPRVVASLQVSPQALELSTGAGSSRMLPILLENTAEVAAGLRVSIVGLAGQPAPDWLVVRPESVWLSGHRDRRIAASVRGRTSNGEPLYAWLELVVTPDDGSLGGSVRIPVALLGSERPEPQISLESLRSTGESELTFICGLANPGKVHVPLRVSLSIADPFGRVLEEVVRGSGVWLLPGEQAELSFPLARPLQNGDYSLTLNVERAGLEPLRITRSWRHGE